MTGDPNQLRTFRIALCDGATLEDAAGRAGISIAEARLTAAVDEQTPPPAEAFVLLGGSPPPPDREVTP